MKLEAVGTLMFWAGLAMLFVIAVSMLLRKPLEAQVGYDPASLRKAGFSEEEIAENMEVRRELRQIAEEQALWAEIARGPSTFKIIGWLISWWLQLCIFIAVTWIAVRWILHAI